MVWRNKLIPLSGAVLWRNRRPDPHGRCSGTDGKSYKAAPVGNALNGIGVGSEAVGKETNEQPPTTTVSQMYYLRLH